MLEDFVSPKHKWVEMNDPGKFVQWDESSFVRFETVLCRVSSCTLAFLSLTHFPCFNSLDSSIVMGGKSTGPLAVDETNHVGVFQGSVEIVSFLNAPGFIKAETVAYKDLVECGSVAAARDKGLYRMEGKEYVVKDGDVLLFKFNV